jgi:hypothetical protein
MDTLTFLEDNKIFVCTKDQLSQCLVKLCMQLSKWTEKTKAEQNNFSNSLFVRLIDIIKSNERVINSMKLEKKEFLEVFTTIIKSIKKSIDKSCIEIFRYLSAMFV